MMNKEDLQVKRRKIAEIVRDSYDVFDTYKMTLSQLEKLISAMIEDLIDYEISDIENAYKDLRKTQSNIPKPSHVLKALQTNQKETGSRYKNYSDFDGDWNAYKRYLHANGILSPNLSYKV